MSVNISIYLRQICLVVTDIEPVLNGLMKILELRPCYTDPGVGEFGLQNVLLPVGSNFLEIVAPIKSDTAARRYLDRRGGDGGYMVICQVGNEQEQETVRKNADMQKVRVAWQSRTEEFSCMQLHPKDMGGAFLEVDWDIHGEFTGSWHPAGGSSWKDAYSIGCVKKIKAVKIQSAKPKNLAKHWGLVSGTKFNLDRGVPILNLANAKLEFINLKDERGDGLSEIDIEVNNARKILERALKINFLVEGNGVYIGGVRFNLFDN